MNPTQLKSLIKTLKAAGVTEFQNGDLKLSFRSVSEDKYPHTPLDAPSQAEDPIKHKIEEMTSLLKLSDVDLVDRLFPDTQTTEEEAS